MADFKARNESFDNILFQNIKKRPLPSKAQNFVKKMGVVDREAELRKNPLTKITHLLPEVNEVQTSYLICIVVVG